MPKQTSIMVPVYRGADPSMNEWAKNMISMINKELLKISGQIDALEIRATAAEARLTAHGI